jgi:aspartyl-tRNA(Asn)/glutamyl-tRNA(Gln) amidotransferase subunit C
MMKDMTAIVNWVEKLNEVNTDGVEPLTTMTYEVNVFREDEVKEHLPHDRALLNAPKKDKDYFRVPKVLE